LVQLELTETPEGYRSVSRILEQKNRLEPPELLARTRSDMLGELESLPTVLTRAVTEVSDVLASRYALGISQFDTQDTDILIYGITKTGDYLALELLLQQTTVLSEMQLVEANAEYLRYRLPAQSDPQKIRSLLVLTGQLKALDENDDLQFVWKSNP
jgi:hypothetical protein